MAVLMPSAWFKQRVEKKRKIISYLSKVKSEDYHILRRFCEGELLSDFVIFREAVSELIQEGKVVSVGNLVSLNMEQKNAGGV